MNPSIDSQLEKMNGQHPVPSLALKRIVVLAPVLEPVRSFNHDNAPGWV